MHQFNFFSAPDLSTMNFLNDSGSQVTFGVSRKVEVSSCSLHIAIYVVQMLCQSLPEALGCLANVLLTTVGHHAVEGIADVAGVAVHLGIDVNSIVGGSGFKVFSRLNVRAHTAVRLSTFPHARYSSSGPGISLWWDLGSD